MMRQSLILIAVSLTLSACSGLRTRSQIANGEGAHSSNYSSYSDDPADLDLRWAEKRNDIARQMGLPPYGDLSRNDRRLVDDRIELMNAERLLEDERDRETYYHAKSEFGSDAERVRFLHLGSFEARQAYLRRHGLLSTNDRFSPEDAHLVVDQDIAVGMNRRTVRASWGDPDNVEVAGNALYGNERWNYVQSVASTEGFKTLKRTIYFEGGQVVGWESATPR